MIHFRRSKVEDGVPEAKQWHAALAQFKIAQVEVERAYRRFHEHLGKLLRRPMRRGKPSTLSGRVAAAIADYERTRMSGNAPYDRWRFNHERNAVSPQAQRGFDLFYDKARCAQCHAGSNFTDSKFWNEGIGWQPQLMQFTDEGRFLVTGDRSDHGAFKTPGLRDVGRHPPYMHDGSLPTLTSVVNFYNLGGNANPYKTRRLVPLGLTPDEVDAIVAFLRTLEGQGYQDTAPTHFPQ